MACPGGGCGVPAGHDRIISMPNATKRTAQISGTPAAAPEAGPYHHVNGYRADLVTRYRGALRAYLEHNDDEHLRPAYQLGCEALRGGMGVFDMACLHEESMPDMGARDAGFGDAAQHARFAETFLLDALSPFEAARRGLPEAYARLGQLNETLERQNKAMGAIAARQHPMEEALRVGKERYVKLLQQARSMKREIRLHAAKVILAQEEERKRVSRELHDEIGQGLVAVSVGLAILKKHAGRDQAFQRRVNATQALLETSMESVHRFARDLRPEMLDLFGPFEAIRTYVKAFAERTGIAARMQTKADLAGLDSEQELVLFRVAQESITNVFKHAQATRVDIRFRRLPREILMEIGDNGRSFSVEDTLRRVEGKRLGLTGMRERVRLVHGELAIESSPGRGTKVRVTFPIALNQDAATGGHEGRVRT
jgi:signal transduction histidine kinase